MLMMVDYGDDGVSCWMWFMARVGNHVDLGDGKVLSWDWIMSRIVLNVVDGLIMMMMMEYHVDDE